MKSIFINPASIDAAFKAIFHDGKNCCLRARYVNNGEMWEIEVGPEIRIENERPDLLCISPPVFSWIVEMLSGLDPLGKRDAFGAFCKWRLACISSIYALDHAELSPGGEPLSFFGFDEKKSSPEKRESDKVKTPD